MIGEIILGAGIGTTIGCTICIGIETILYYKWKHWFYGRQEGWWNK